MSSCSRRGTGGGQVGGGGGNSPPGILPAVNNVDAALTAMAGALAGQSIDVFGQTSGQRFCTFLKTDLGLVYCPFVDFRYGDLGGGAPTYTIGTGVSDNIQLDSAITFSFDPAQGLVFDGDVIAAFQFMGGFTGFFGQALFKTFNNGVFPTNSYAIAGVARFDSKVGVGGGLRSVPNDNTFAVGFSGAMSAPVLSSASSNFPSNVAMICQGAARGRGEIGDGQFTTGLGSSGSIFQDVSGAQYASNFASFWGDTPTVWYPHAALSRAGGSQTMAITSISYSVAL